jgi:hypothetical protein
MFLVVRESAGTSEPLTVMVAPEAFSQRQLAVAVLAIITALQT